MRDFDDSLSLGAMPPEAIASYLQEVGDDEGAAMLRRTNAAGQGSGPLSRPHLQTGVRVGFVPQSSDKEELDIIPGSRVAPDSSLLGSRIKVTLDRFYVHNFPGFGEHQILCEFAGRNQCQDASEEVRFALTVAARDGSGAAVTGIPIFVGLTVGADGVAFRGKTVNVRNSSDEWLLDALGSETFRSGLSLITTAQPVLRPFVKLAADAVSSTLKRRRNAQISAFDLGLDFSSSSTSAKLSLGSYVIVQGDADTWSWNDVKLLRDSNKLVGKINDQPLGQNYMILGITPAFSTVATAASNRARDKPAQEDSRTSLVATPRTSRRGEQKSSN